jgi:TrmH family RNA methyltransferase
MTLSKPKLKELRSLTHKKYRDEEKKFLVEGFRMVSDAVDSGFKILEVYYTREVKESSSGKGLLQRLSEKTTSLIEISDREMELISETVTFQGIVAVLRQKRFSIDAMLESRKSHSRLVAFDGVSDPGNAGTMIRTCDWFGVDGVILGGASVELYNPKVIRATMGGMFHLPIAEGVDLLPTLSRARDLGYKVYVTCTDAESHFDRVQYDARSIIVFGNEAWGVSDQVKQLADVHLAIRRYGLGESLNVSVACGIILSSIHRLYD